MCAMKAQRSGKILALTDPRHLVLVALMHWPPSASGDLVGCPSTHNLDEISSWVLEKVALTLDGCLDSVPPEAVYANGQRWRLYFRPEHYEASAITAGWPRHHDAPGGMQLLQQAMVWVVPGAPVLPLLQQQLAPAWGMLPMGMPVGVAGPTAGTAGTGSQHGCHSWLDPNLTAALAGPRLPPAHMPMHAVPMLPPPPAPAAPIWPTPTLMLRPRLPLRPSTNG